MHRSLSPNFRPAEFWAVNVQGSYHVRTTHEEHIRSPVHRTLHQLLVTLFIQRPGPHTVQHFDLFFMCCLISKKETYNVPHAIACYLYRMATEAPETLFLGGGNFITRLARSRRRLLGFQARKAYMDASWGYSLLLEYLGWLRQFHAVKDYLPREIGAEEASPMGARTGH
ncbi:hypothetical protein L2E82_15520 [Cichorium intybus]|uniref:Uncharacterized protein n=1 Tax=Cichorium intybus TaxID=13427 RepID=A0ACB9F3K4_CICIN|nr:hypothetical protein L2E82_15520 [Cichorium intybus]